MTIALVSVSSLFLSHISLLSCPIHLRPLSSMIPLVVLQLIINPAPSLFLCRFHIPPSYGSLGCSFLINNVCYSKPLCNLNPPSSMCINVTQPPLCLAHLCIDSSVLVVLTILWYSWLWPVCSASTQIIAIFSIYKFFFPIWYQVRLFNPPTLAMVH